MPHSTVAARKRYAAGTGDAMRRKMHNVHPRGGSPLPVVVLEGDAPGPTVAVTGNVHGDEATGLVAAHELDLRLRESLRCGRVVLYPSVNPGGLRARTRTEPGGVDLNRAFPGDPRGGTASRIAAALWSDLGAHRVDAVLDLHADAAVSIPYVIVDRPVALRATERAAMEARLATLAGHCGLTALMEYRAPEYIRFGLDRSLAGALVNAAKVPALTLEIGPRRSVDPAAVEVAVGAVWGVLAGLQLVDGAPAPHPTRVAGGPWRRSPAPRVQTAGVFVPHVHPGVTFAAQDVLGTVRGVDGAVLERVVAPGSGVVVSWADATWVEPRAVVGTLGLEDR
ncbi:MAG: putative deacylase [Myxococcota bacterium]|jgi:predicted deacylase